MAHKKTTATDLATVEKTAETPSRKRTLPIVLMVFLMVAILAVAVWIFLRNQSMNTEIIQLQEDLSTSQDRWQSIAEEKETLQAELEEIQGQIREAKLTIDESTRRIEDLNVQIEELNGTNSVLNAQLSSNTQRTEALTEALKKLSETEKMLETSTVVITDQMDKRNGAATGGLWAGLSAARLAMLDVWRAEVSALEGDYELLNKQLSVYPEKGYEPKVDAIRETMQTIQDKIAEIQQKILEYDSE